MKLYSSLGRAAVMLAILAATGTFGISIVGAAEGSLVGKDGSQPIPQDEKITFESNKPPVGAILIDERLLVRSGQKPIILNRPDTIYFLTTDIRSDGTAFVVGAKNVTLDLNGHSVIYGDSPEVVVPNGGFEQGNDKVVPGWSLTKAPSSKRVKARTGMSGEWMLEFTQISDRQVIVSDPIAIPLTGREYSTSVSVKGPHDSMVTISVLDGLSDTVLGKGSSENPD